MHADAESTKATILLNLYTGYCSDPGYLAEELYIYVDFYQGGIMKVLVDDIDHDETTRFRISQEDLPVEWD